MALLFASPAAVGAAWLAWQAVHEPWVILSITDTREGLDPTLVGRVSLLGGAAFVGVLGRAVAAVLGIYAVTWLYFGLDRGSTIPWFFSPPIPLVAVVAAVFGAALSATVWLVWEEAAVAHARDVGLSMRELRAFLDLQPPPVVEIERLSGLFRFGGGLLLGLLASITAWWSTRKRA